jgi:hypothetical protein
MHPEVPFLIDRVLEWIEKGKATRSKTENYRHMWRMVRGQKIGEQKGRRLDTWRIIGARGLGETNIHAAGNLMSS